MRALVVLSLLAAAPLARAQTALNVDGGQSTLSYTIVHKLHKVTGVSKKVTGKAVLAPDGKAQVVVTVPSDSFDSENVNRDAHMKEAVEAQKYPTVELRALADGLQPPASFPSTVKKTFKVQLTFHGQKALFEVPVDVTWEAADRVKAASEFKISLDGYKVERPALLFVKVDDDLVINAQVVFKK
jgi:polyisoprenoid-binding protein YceI